MTLVCIAAWLIASAAGARAPLDAMLRRAGDDLEVEALIEADRRRLGMTWNAMRTIRPRSRLMVTGRLVRSWA